MNLSRSAALCLLLACSGLLRAEEVFSIDLGNGLKLDLVLIKAGTFTQGSPATEAGRGNDENQREVTITSDFYLGKYPVTRGQFARFVSESGFKTEAEKGASGGYGLVGKELVQRKDFTWKNPGFQQGEDHPVTLVTYDDALAFAKWLSRKTGRTVNLPTEAQWEYSCRAGTITRFYSGDDEAQLGSIAWFKGNSGDGTRTVSGRNANAWGVYDMNGNVYEWCRDWYSPVYAPGPVNDPEETRSNLSDKPRRILRGGSFFKDAKACRSAARWRNDSRSRNADNGFRIVASTQASAVVPPPVPAQPPVQFQPTPNVESPRPSPAYTPPVQPSFNSPAQSSSSSVGFLAIFLILGVVGLIVAFIVYKIVSAASGSRGPAFTNVRPRAAADGFFLDGAAPGSVVRYRYRNGNSWQDGSYTVIDSGPQGMFVYTGHRPGDIEILDIVSSGSTYTSHSSPPIHTTSRSSSSSFSGYPSAY